MALIINELGEFVEPYEPKPLMKLRYTGPVKVRDDRKPPEPKPARKRVVSVCEECGGEFVMKMRTQRFCCKRCCKRWHNARKGKR